MSENADGGMPNVHSVDMSYMAPQSPAPEASEAPVASAEERAEQIVADSVEVSAEKSLEVDAEKSLEAESSESSEEQLVEAEAVKKLDEDKSLWDSRFAALSRKEKAILEKEKALKEQNARIGEIEELLGNAKENPMSLLEKAGISFDDLVQQQLGIAKEEEKADDPNEKYKMLENKLEEMEKRLADEKEQAKSQAEEQAIDDFKYQISSHIEDNASEFEIINHLGEQELVFNLIEQHYNDTDEILEVGKACRMIEDQLFETFKGAAEKIGKLRGLIPTAQEPELGEKVEEKAEIKPAQESIHERQKMRARTLSNKNVASTSLPKKGYGIGDRDQSIAEAAKLIKWTD